MVGYNCDRRARSVDPGCQALAVRTAAVQCWAVVLQGRQMGPPLGAARVQSLAHQPLKVPVRVWGLSLLSKARNCWRVHVCGNHTGVGIILIQSRGNLFASQLHSIRTYIILDSLVNVC